MLAVDVNKQETTYIIFLFELWQLALRQVSGIKYLNKMSTYHFVCDNRGLM